MQQPCRRQNSSRKNSSRRKSNVFPFVASFSRKSSLKRCAPSARALKRLSTGTRSVRLSTASQRLRDQLNAAKVSFRHALTQCRQPRVKMGVVDGSSTATANAFDRERTRQPSARALDESSDSIFSGKKRRPRKLYPSFSFYLWS